MSKSSKLWFKQCIILIVLSADAITTSSILISKVARNAGKLQFTFISTPKKNRENCLKKRYSYEKKICLENYLQSIGNYFKELLLDTAIYDFL